MRGPDIAGDHPDELEVARALSQLRDRSEEREKLPIDTDSKVTSSTDHKESANSDDTLDLDDTIPAPELTYFDHDETKAKPPQPPQPPQWRNMLLTATSLVLTKDARRKFRKMLSVLKLASEHLNARVIALKEAMELEATQDNVKPKLSSVAIRNDIVITIKKCLTMLSTLATSSLPASASATVRSTILKLPSQWANQLGDPAASAIDGKSESAVLALASETLVSIRKITNVLSETLERADSWVERLPTFIGKRMRDTDPKADSPSADDNTTPPTKTIKKD